jgi:putative ABC transport system permease protein
MRARLGSLLRNLFRTERVERELDDEVRAFLELSVQQKIDGGMDPVAAGRSARLELGGLAQVKEEVREVRAGAWVHALVRDLRHGLRMLRRTPGFTAVAIATLALGIGANTAIFSVIDGVLLHAAPLDEVGDLAVVWETDRHSGTSREPASLPDFDDFSARSASFASMAAFVAGEANLAGEAGDPRRIAALAVSERLFSSLGVAPLLGRTFTAGEMRLGGPDAVVISEGLWAQEFGRSPDALGRVLRLDDVAHVVVGVVPDAADFGVLQILSAAAYSRAFADRGGRAEVDVWVPLRPEPMLAARSSHPAFLLGRLAPGRSVSQAQDELAGVAADLERAYRENDGRGVFVEPLTEVVFAPVRPALLLLLGTVLLVLLVASVNVANLLLARGASRAREIAVRTALGATRARLTRQFLAESMLLALAAAIAGLGFAALLLELLLALAPADVPRLDGVGLDWRVLVFTLAVSIGVGLLFGLVPALQARRVPVQAALKGDGHQATPGRARRRLRAALVVAQLGLAVMLVTGAGLLVRSFWVLRDVDPGFRTDGVLKAEVQLPKARYPVDFRRWPDFAEMHRFNEALLAGVSALPGVEVAAVAGNHPLDPGFTNSFSVVGREAEAGGWPEITVRRVSPGYFRAVDLPVLRGRALGEADATAGEPVLLINQAAAERFFGGRDPLGGQIRMWGASRRIVGVVGNERLRGPAAAAPLAVYLPLAQAPSADGGEVVLMRVRGDPAALAPAVSALVRRLDPGLAVFGVEPLERTLDRSVSQRRFVMLLLVFFAGLALALAAIGVYGVLAYGVVERRREIGIRLALGAQPGAVRRRVVGQGLVLAGAGVLLGVAGAAGLARFLESMLFGVAPTDAATLASVALFLLVVALAASYLPARQATRIDPLAALRGE